MSKWELEQYTQTVNGIQFRVTQWGKLLIVCWDGAPTQTMPVEAWYDFAVTIPDQAINYLVPFQPVYRSCKKLYAYSIQCGTDRFRIYPRGGAITSSDYVSGQLITFAQ